MDALKVLKETTRHKVKQIFLNTFHFARKQHYYSARKQPKLALIERRKMLLRPEKLTTRRDTAQTRQLRD